MKMIDDRYRSRKYSLAMFFAIANTIAIFFGFMSDVQYVMGQIGILGMYGAANVMNNSSKVKNKEIHE